MSITWHGPLRTGYQELLFDLLCLRVHPAVNWNGACFADVSLQQLALNSWLRLDYSELEQLYDLARAANSDTMHDAHRMAWNVIVRDPNMYASWNALFDAGPALSFMRCIFADRSNTFDSYISLALFWNI